MVIGLVGTALFWTVVIIVLAVIGLIAILRGRV